jgi:transposase
MSAPRKYPEELRERAIRLVCDLVEDDPDAMSVTGACPAYG